MNKLTPIQLLEIKKLRDEGMTLTELAKRFNVRQPTITYHVNPLARARVIKRVVESFRNSSPEKKKEFYLKRKAYSKKYLLNRYHNDKEFREKWIAREMAYQKRKKEEKKQDEIQMSNM